MAPAADKSILPLINLHASCCPGELQAAGARPPHPLTHKALAPLELRVVFTFQQQQTAADLGQSIDSGEDDPAGKATRKDVIFLRLLPFEASWRRAVPTRAIGPAIVRNGTRSPDRRKPALPARSAPAGRPAWCERCSGCPGPRTRCQSLHLKIRRLLHSGIVLLTLRRLELVAALRAAGVTGGCDGTRREIWSACQ